MTYRKLSNTRINPNFAKIASPDLTREFEETIDDWGSRVLYVRRDKNVHCECWDPVSRQPDGLCLVCYGTGFRIQIERHFGRYFAESTPGRLAQSTAEQEPGVFYVTLRSVYLKPGVRVKTKDLIFRVEWNEITERPKNLIQTLVIRDVDDQRQEQGDLSFYKVYCDTASINQERIEEALRVESRIMIVD